MSEPSETSPHAAQPHAAQPHAAQPHAAQPHAAQASPRRGPLHHIGLAAGIVSAYVSNNSVPTADLPSFINEVHGALLSVGASGLAVAVEPPKPAVSPKKSITDEYLICLEDGRRFKSLKRHLRTKYDLSPEQYREKWGLAADYPMVAPSYAKARSTLAKEMGLGQQRRRRP